MTILSHQMKMMQAATNLQHAEHYPYKYINDSTSLLAKYEIPVTHLDFSYVEKCEDRKELERILHVLKSGQEGYYPDLMRAVEKKLELVYPKSKFLRNTSRVLTKDELEKEEWDSITKNLDEWIINVSKESEELENRKGKTITYCKTEIREILEDTCPAEIETKKPQKIKSTDYDAWDKYDVDAEILDIELKEEKMKSEAKVKSSNETGKQEVKFAEFATEVEGRAEAKEEREKGNEYFRAGDYQAALKHYSASVDCFPTVEALNNRAMAYLKLSLYEDAISDCDSTLSLDRTNLKANWRKAIALDHLKHYEEALRYAEECIAIEPNDEKIQDFANNVRKKCNIADSNKKRMVVKNVSEEPNGKELEDATDDQIIRVPIPGTSRMAEPYYIKCEKNDKQRVTSLLYKKRTDQETVSFIEDMSEYFDHDLNKSHIKKEIK